ncbi:protein PIN-LIKES 6-like [Oryza brachyantha]|uniref:Auxin efflux carrier family protein n=1 Tax=Oryza brachyantha TaxID=4533 RepID=J3L592_ORYBR|nr:protein PIN-LIKES 6-like [Oryza brachyantha]
MMKRSLMEALATAVQGGAVGTSIFDMAKYAMLPIAKVFTVCFMGFLMASKYINILQPNGRRLLNGLVFSLLLPCLIFSQLGRAITIEKMLQWWYIPVNIVVGSVSGSLIGYVVACIIRPPYPYFKFTVIHIGIGNIGNIPLVLIAALCRDPTNPFGDSDKCNEDGNAYISFGQWVGAIIVYTYVFKMLAPPPGESFDNAEEEKLPVKASGDNVVPEVGKSPTITRTSTVPENEPLLSAEGDKNGATSLGSKIMSHVRRVIKFLKDMQLLQPPIIASVFAIVIGVVPVLKNFVLTDEAPLFFFTDSCLILGEAMIPCILLAVGGNLVDGPGEGSKRLGVRTTVAIIFARLVLVPLAGVGIVLLVDKLGFIPKDDKMFKFVLLLQHSMPTSVLSGAVANLRGCGKESASILFWVHIFAVLSMAGWIILYLNLLF